MVKRLIAKARDMGLIPGPGRFTCRAAAKLRQRPWALRPRLCNRRNHCSETPMHRNQSHPGSPHLERACMRQ